jgi:hypothetical protein
MPAAACRHSIDSCTKCAASAQAPRARERELDRRPDRCAERIGWGTWTLDLLGRNRDHSCTQRQFLNESVAPFVMRLWVLGKARLLDDVVAGAGQTLPARSRWVEGPSGTHALLVVDRADRHSASDLVMPEKFTLVLLQPNSLELNATAPGAPPQGPLRRAPPRAKWRRTSRNGPRTGPSRGSSRHGIGWSDKNLAYPRNNPAGNAFINEGNN